MVERKKSDRDAPLEQPVAKPIRQDDAACDEAAECRSSPPAVKVFD